MAILGVDVGGTFTDAVLLRDGVVRTAKVPTGARQEESVARGRAGGRRGGCRALPPRDDGRDERAPRAQGRADRVRDHGRLRAPAAPAPADARAPLPAVRRAPRAARPARARVTACESGSGPRACSSRSTCGSLPELDAEAVAVCLLFSFRDPAHERAVADELRRRYPTAHVVASHEVAPEFREYERCLDHGRRRVPRSAPRRLPRRARERVRRRRPAGAARDALVRRSRLARRGGGARRVRRSSPGRPRASSARPVSRVSPGIEHAIAFDMGGTSTDVCADHRRRARPGARAVGRRPPGPAARARRPHGRRRRRLARLARCGRRAAGRAAERGRGAGSGVLRPWRHARRR